VTDTRSWWPEGYGEDPAFQLRRQIYGTVTGGDYTRGSGVLTLPHTALRYPTEVAGTAEAVGRAILHVRVKDHGIERQPIREDGLQVGFHNIPIGTIEITWGWPASIENVWTEVALVRSAFGRPSTVNDGQTILSAPHSAFVQRDANGNPVIEEGATHPNMTQPPIVEDRLLPPGRWYHYGLFFKVSEVEWIQGMVDSTLLPRDFGHDQHLWNSLPPYYRWTDENSLVGAGFLRQFLNVFAFELDTTREYIESWQHVYDADWSPIRLLRKLGQNFGYEYEQGIGDIRYRSLFSEIGSLYETRGTQECLEGVIQRMSKYHCNVIGGTNLMLLPNDSDFYTGTGNWGGSHPTIDGPGLPVNYINVTVAKATGITPPEGVGRGVMSVTTPKVNVGDDLAISCGANYIHPEGQPWTEVTPLEGGIPVEEGMSYGFSVYIKPAVAPVSPQLALLWFRAGGTAADLISYTAGIIDLAESTDWERFDIGVMTAPPAGAVYVVPYILFDVRTDSGAYTTSAPPIYIAGAMVYGVPAIGEATGPPPNQFLTVSDPGEPLGGALIFKGTLSGAGTALPSGPTLYDAWAVGTPVPTAIPRYQGITPDRAAQVGDSIYWNGTAWVNIGATPASFEAYILGQP
jgi:hypothetical protein